MADKVNALVLGLMVLVFMVLVLIVLVISIFFIPSPCRERVRERG
jgi:uncharacterized membrane protein